MCVDYRKLNSVTINDPYPLQNIEQLIANLRNSRYITTLDLTKGYLQVPVKRDQIKKTAFITPYGKYEYLTKPFRLVTAPSTFQRLMDRILHGISSAVMISYPRMHIVSARRDKEVVLKNLSKKVIDSFSFINFNKNEKPKSPADDGVLDYAKETLTLSLLYAEFDDAIREGDGIRMIRCWKFLFLVFKASNCKNYSIEALTLLAQYYILLPPRQAQQLAWSRVVNSSGKPGGNKWCDLEMEYLNHACKDGISDLHADITPQLFVRLGKCIGPLTKLCKQFDKTSGVPPMSRHHSKANFNKDFKKIINELSGHSLVFDNVGGRRYDSFKTFSGSFLQKHGKKVLIE